MDEYERTRMRVRHNMDQVWAAIRDHKADIERIARGGPSTWDARDLKIVHATMCAVAGDLLAGVTHEL